MQGEWQTNGNECYHSNLLEGKLSHQESLKNVNLEAKQTNVMSDFWLKYHVD